MLTKKRQVERTTQGYKLSQLGLNHFNSLLKTKKRVKNQKKTIALDELRLEILNMKYRRKKIVV